jgi:hypothetical protein
MLAIDPLGEPKRQRRIPHPSAHRLHRQCYRYTQLSHASSPAAAKNAFDQYYGGMSLFKSNARRRRASRAGQQMAAGKAYFPYANYVELHSICEGCRNPVCYGPVMIGCAGSK